MNNHILENERLKITVNEHGAELAGIYDKTNDREIVWCADPAFWNRHAPVLFPNVGQYYGGAFIYKEKFYMEGQHGFARDKEFVLCGTTEDSVTYRLTSDETTKVRYPFDFVFEVTHKLTGNVLEVIWTVKNTGKETMYFTIGGHPAFNVPAEEGKKFSDYFLTFADDQDELVYKLIDLSCGCAYPDSKEILKLTEHKYQIKEDMFDKDALVFDDYQIRRVGIAHPDGRPYVTMLCEGFPNYGIWSKPGAPYVCLEPWIGRCDNVGFEGDISEKPGITALEAGKTFNASYKIVIE